MRMQVLRTLDLPTLVAQLMREMFFALVSGPALLCTTPTHQQTHGNVAALAVVSALTPHILISQNTMVACACDLRGPLNGGACNVATHALDHAPLK
jgi:hypothetical protein